MSHKSLNLLLLSLFILAACGGGGSSSGSTTTGCSPSATNLCITVQEASSGAYGSSTTRKYVVQNSSSAGVAQKTLTLNAGTYVFDQSDSSNTGHPLIFLTTGGVAYTTGVTTSGTPGTDGKTQIVITDSTPGTFNYGCSIHEGMGGVINIVLGQSSNQVEFTETSLDTNT